MNRFKKMLAGFGIALGLVALPLSAGAGTAGVQTNHRIFTQEAAQRAQYEPMANYMMRDVSPLEEIAGQENLDWETIKFLEDNLWDHDIIARTEGDADAAPLDNEEDCSVTIAEIYPDLEYSFLEENICGPGDTARYQGGLDDSNVSFDQEDPPLSDTWVDPYFLTPGAGAEILAEVPADGVGVEAIELDMFSDEIPWQDEFEPVAHVAGEADGTNGGAYGVDPNMFSEEILWQDRADLIAYFAQTDAENYYPSPEDVPQLRAGELNY